MWGQKSVRLHDIPQERPPKPKTLMETLREMPLPTWVTTWNVDNVEGRVSTIFGDTFTDYHLQLGNNVYFNNQPVGRVTNVQFNDASTVEYTFRRTTEMLRAQPIPLNFTLTNV